jgi:hypothetical protein
MPYKSDGCVGKSDRWAANLYRWLAKFVARTAAAAAAWVRMQTSLRNHKMVDVEKESPRYSSLPNKYKNNF